MKKVITYGTYDLFHDGHYNLLKNAKNLGDYLIVAVTSDAFDKARGKLNVHDSLVQRIKNVENTGLADEIIVEEYFGQKIDDIKKHDIDIFTVGSDWIGHFDYLNEYCKVIYLDRTMGISSTELRNKKAVNLGIIGAYDIVRRFKNELKFVGGINLVGIYDEDADKLNAMAYKVEINPYKDVNSLYADVDSIYIATPPKYHYKDIKNALLNDKHVLCEFPFCLDTNEAKELFEIAEARKLILMEALKTAYCPAFCKIVPIVKSGLIGNILSVDACFTQVHDSKITEQIELASGGSINALASYPLLAIFKFLGVSYLDVNFVSKFNSDGIDIFTKFNILFKDAIGTGTVAIDAKNEGTLTVTGTKGYLYVPAPWWKTDYFEVRFEDINKNNKYFYRFEADGLRYEINSFIDCVRNKIANVVLTKEEILAEVSIIEKFSSKYNVKNI